MKAAIFLINISLILFSYASHSKSYDLEQLSVEPFEGEIKRTGKVDFKRVLNLSFKSNGYLTQLSVDSGDYFEKNQLLASLDIEELNAQKNADYAKLLHAKRDVKRIGILLEKEMSSERELDISKTLVETARADYKISYYKLEKAQIIAPFSGVVLARYSELGELQTPGVEALKVAALGDNYVVKVTLTASEVSQIYLNQKVDVLLDRKGKVEGLVSKIPAIANVDGHLFEIEISLLDLSLKQGIIAGQLAEVTIVINSENYVYKLPIQALNSVDENGKALVLIQPANHKKFIQQAFDIYRLDNNSVYLRAHVYDKPLNIVTQGWQNITVSKR